MGHVLAYLLDDETRKTHRGTWYVWAGGQRLRHNTQMRGMWGWDVACKCGWESRTGGATRHSVDDLFWDHRWSEQCDRQRRAEAELIACRVTQETVQMLATGVRGVTVDVPELNEIWTISREGQAKGTTMTGAYDMYRRIESVTEFTVTGTHLELLRNTCVWWNHAEFGAPGIDPKKPYGNGDVLRDIARILGVPDSEWLIDPGDDYEGPEPDAEAGFLRLHAETGIVLQIVLAAGQFQPGRYVRDPYRTNWRPADPEGPDHAHGVCTG